MEQAADAPITRAQAESITYLSGSRSKISDLSGIESLKNLESLHLYRNRIKSIAPLPSPQKLDHFSAKGQRVELPTVKRNKWVKNPIRDLSGSVVKVKSSSSDFKPSKGTKMWKFTKKGSKKLTWKYEIGATDTYLSGTIVQKVKKWRTMPWRENT